MDWWKVREVRREKRKAVEMVECEKGEMCVICLEGYGAVEALYVLDCTHRFHKACILKWKKENDDCPVCRA